MPLHLFSRWREQIFICLAVLIAYASVWPNEFVFDDKYLILFNDYLRHWSHLPQILTSLNFEGGGIISGFYRPVPMVLHFFVYQVFGASTVAFHALNIALQASNACLLYHFAIRTGFKKGVALAAALLWAVHPLHTEAVTYMASTPELLWSTFCLLGLITLLPDFTTRKIWQAAVFFLLALGCKESAVVFPALAATTIFLVDKNRAQFSSYLKTWPLWLLAAAYIIVWSVFMHQTGYSMDKGMNAERFQDYTSHLPNRVFTSLAYLPVYARLIVWPTGLHMEWPFIISTFLPTWQTVAGGLLVGLGLLQILWGGARRGLALSFGLLWFATAHSPNTGIVIPINALISEHWMYLPTMGLFLGLTQTAAEIFEKKENLARLIVVTVVFALGVTTFLQNKAWRNVETLYRNIVQNEGSGHRLCPGLGIFYLKRGEFDKAIEPLQCALDHPFRPRGPRQTAEVHLWLAMAWLHVPMDEKEGAFLQDVSRAVPTSRHLPEVIRELGQVLRNNPDFHWAHAALVIIYQHQGNSQMADFHLKRLNEVLQGQAGQKHAD